MCSPSYARAIGWISKIWEEFPPTAISHSFDSCGVSKSDQDLFYRQLRYFARTNELRDDIEEADEEPEIDGFHTGVSEDGQRFEDVLEEDSDDDESDEIDNIIIKLN